MRALPLGKITVATAGTPVPITNAMLTTAGDGRGPNGGVMSLEFWPVFGNTGRVLVKDLSTGNVIAELPTPANGKAQKYRICGPDGGNVVYPTSFQVDVTTSGDAAYVTAWVE